MTTKDTIMALADNYADTFGECVRFVYETWHSVKEQEDIIDMRDQAHQKLEAAVEAALAPQQVPEPLTARELELIDGMIGVQLEHAMRCDQIANRRMAEKQKGWDMERVALLQKIKAASPQPAPQPTGDVSWALTLELLKRERDDLLGVLKFYLRAWDGGEVQWFKDCYKAEERVRAAIAKVEGGAE